MNHALELNSLFICGLQVSCSKNEGSKGAGSDGCGKKGQSEPESLLGGLPLRTPAFTHQKIPLPSFQLPGQGASVAEGCGLEGSALTWVGLPLSEDSIGLAVLENR